MAKLNKFLKKYKLSISIISLIIIGTVGLLIVTQNSKEDKGSKWNGIFEVDDVTNIKRQLTQEEIDSINTLFEQIIPSDEPEYEYMINPICSFFTSYYEAPEKMNLERFVEYFSGESSLSDENLYHVEQFEALKELPQFPFRGARTIESLNLSVNKKPAKAVDDMIQRYMGITLDDLTNTGGAFYLEKPYDAFYTLTSDAGAGYFTCHSGEIGGDTIQLFSNESILTLQREDDEYFIVSHMENNELENFITLNDLLLVNHSILDNTPMLLTPIQDLTKGLDFSIKTINAGGANDFIYTIFNSPDISYVCVGSSLDMTDSPTYFIVTSDEYQLPSTLKVGLSKEEALNLYQSNLQYESFEWDHTMNDIMRSIISYDEVYYYYGEVTSKESEKYGMWTSSIAPSGLCVFLKDEQVIAFSNFIPGAN